MAERVEDEMNCNGDGLFSNNISKDGNRKLQNGVDLKEIHEKHMQKRNKSHSILAVLSAILQILFSIVGWTIIVVLVLPISPFALVFIIAKFIERYWCWYFKGIEAVSGGDSVWMSNGPENPGIISSLMIFKGEIDVEAFRRRIFETMVMEKAGNNGKLHPYRRSTKMASVSLLNHFWKEEKNFDMNDHVSKHSKEMASKAELRNIISDLCVLPFKEGISQWEFVVIPWVQNGVKKTVILFRMHHSLADGGALINYLTNVIPDTQGEPIKLKKFSQTGRFLMMLKGTLLSPIFLVRMIFHGPDSTILHGKPLVGQKVVTWSEPMDIEVFKKIKTVTNTTLNDVLVSCMAASVREFFIKKNLEPPRDLRVSIPIDLRKNTESDAIEFENRFAVLQLSLPIGISDPLAQLYEVQNRMNTLKTSGEPFSVGPTMELLLNLLPTSIISPFFDFIVQKCTGVLSNVPGPQISLKVVGQELESITFWAPPRANLGMTFSITSYNGTMVIGVQSDKAILKEPDEICREFPSQVDRLINRLQLQEKIRNV